MAEQAAAVRLAAEQAAVASAKAAEQAAIQAAVASATAAEQAAELVVKISVAASEQAAATPASAPRRYSNSLQSSRSSPASAY